MLHRRRITYYLWCGQVVVRLWSGRGRVVVSLWSGRGQLVVKSLSVGRPLRSLVHSCTRHAVSDQLNDKRIIGGHFAYDR